MGVILLSAKSNEVCFILQSDEWERKLDIALKRFETRVGTLATVFVADFRAFRAYLENVSCKQHLPKTPALDFKRLYHLHSSHEAFLIKRVEKYVL